MEALQFAQSDKTNHFLVCTDFLSSLQSIDTCFPQHPLVQQNHDLLARLCDVGIRITFAWLPSHVGIVGNELTDEAAKEAVLLPPRPVDVPASDICSQLRRSILASWESEWIAIRTPNKLRAIKKTTTVWRSSFRPSRRESVVLCRLRIGHGRSTHSYLLKREGPPRPPLCSCGADFTVAHILTECADLSGLRRNIGLQETFELILADDEPTADLVIRLMSESGLIKGDAVNCYECNSYVDAGCDDDIPPENYKTNCSEKYNVSYPLCRKAVLHTEAGLRGKSDGEKRVIRSCGWLNTSSAHSCRRSSGAGWYQMTCSCIEEYCNSAPRISLSLATMGMLLLHVLNIF